MPPSSSDPEAALYRVAITDLFRRLLEIYGPQGWWPGNGGFEVVVGALLVQRTSWRNAELALELLRQSAFLTPAALAAADLAEIEALVRSAGFYRSKARRLRGVAAWISREGGLETLAGRETTDLRGQLLAQEGIGPETADTILLYAFGRPVVVVDTYLRRLLERLVGRAPTDAVILRAISRNLNCTAELNEFHALVVAHGKARCGARPICKGCEIISACQTGRTSSDA